MERHVHSQRVTQNPRVSECFYQTGEHTADQNQSGTSASRFPDLAFPTTVHRSYDIKKSETRQSRRLPHWAWYLLVRFLGIKLHPNDKPIFGTFMHVFTLAFSFAYIVTYTWYTAYDIKNEYTKQTVLTGLISIVMVSYWSCLGIYANKLAARLFSSQKFVDSVRLHTRTVFKISAAGLMILIATASTILNNYTAAGMYSAEKCQNLTVSEEVCYVMFSARVGYSIFSLIWNLLVGIVLLSVCRTHTIGIRRFIKQLEQDGHVYEQFVRNMYSNHGILPDITLLPEDDELYELDDNFSPIIDEYYAIPSPKITPTPTNSPTHPRFPGGFGTIETNTPRGGSVTDMESGGLDNPTMARNVTMDTQGEVLVDIAGEQAEPRGSNTVHQTAPIASVTVETHPESSDAGCRKRPTKKGSTATSEESDADLAHVESDHNLNTRKPNENADIAAGSDGMVVTSVADTDVLDNRVGSRSTQHSTVVELNSPIRQVSSTPSIAADDDSSVSPTSGGPNMLSPDSILLCYWRIGCRLRSTSIALQRWLVAWVCFILAWSVSFIVSWIHHEATLTEIAAFVLPILLLPLVCSAYGEVNMEGKRMVMSVCPTDDRTYMLMYLEKMPLQLMVFGFPISYSTIVKVVGALGVAFGTKIILEEFSIFK